MFVDILLIGSGAMLFYLQKDELAIKRKFKKIMDAYPGAFTNHLGKTLKILDMEKTDYGWDIKIELPYTYTFDDMKSHLPVFEEGMGFKEIQAKPYGNICYWHCITNKEFKVFKKYQLPPNVLLIADGLKGPIIVDMNQFPHMIIGGDPGTGKSRLLLSMLTNLIVTTSYKELKLYLLQIEKSDLIVFEHCAQVQNMSRTMKDVLESLKEIDKERQERDQLIDPANGIYSIKDYNEKNPNNKLPYIYVVIEEFSFLNVEKSDFKHDKEVKLECLSLIRSIAAAGRSAGCFLIASLQRPTNDSIPSFIKTLITTRVSLRIADKAPAEVINGNMVPTKLDTREVCVRSYDEVIGYTYTINHDVLMENIKSKIISKQNKQAIKTAKLKSKKISLLGKVGELIENETD